MTNVYYDERVRLIEVGISVLNKKYAVRCK